MLARYKKNCIYHLIHLMRFSLEENLIPIVSSSILRNHISQDKRIDNKNNNNNYWHLAIRHDTTLATSEIYLIKFFSHRFVSAWQEEP